MFDNSILERMKSDHYKPSVIFQTVDRVDDELLENFDLSIYRDPQRLERSGRGVDFVLLTPFHGPLDQCNELLRRRNGLAAFPLFNDPACDPP